MDRRLRDAAKAAQVNGQEWELVVAIPPPSAGLGPDRRVETLIVGDRAAQRHGLRVVWGRWNADENTIGLDDGRTLDLAGTAHRPRRSQRAR